MTLSIAKLPLTKIVATIGPSSSSQDILEKLFDAGTSVFRLNFGHGTLDNHTEVVNRIRHFADECKRQVAILGDLQGPKIRIHKVEEGGVNLSPGDVVIFQRKDIETSREMQPVRFSCTYSGFVDDVNVGDRVLVNDGAVRMLVIDKRDDEFECTVKVGGLVTSGKGINLPESVVSAPALSEYDHECVKWAVEQEIDFLALSFVRSNAEIRELQRLIRQTQQAQCNTFSLPIIAKIELPAAVENINSILEVADGIMVARGDLGVEMEIARVPVIQRKLIAAAQAYAKPCIVATQMLESMIHAQTPTRAEASDIANAIFSRVDAVMLSGETAVGDYPVLAVEQMRMIAQYTEEHIATQPQAAAPPSRPIQQQQRTAALAHGVLTVAIDTGAKAIIVWSQLGGGARMLSQNDVSIPIIAMSSDARALKQMQLFRGVTGVKMGVPADLAEFTLQADAFLLERGWAKKGDTAILVAGSTIGIPKSTNSLAIHEVGNPASGSSKTVTETDKVGISLG